MLKFVNEDGELRYVLLDTDTQPREVNKIAKEVLRDLGILLEDDDAEENPKPSGISQDDIKHLKGE
jgi:hypothetical protein